MIFLFQFNIFFKQFISIFKLFQLMFSYFWDQCWYLVGVFILIWTLFDGVECCGLGLFLLFLGFFWFGDFSLRSVWVYHCYFLFEIIINHIINIIDFVYSQDLLFFSKCALPEVKISCVRWEISPELLRTAL